MSTIRMDKFVMNVQEVLEQYQPRARGKIKLKWKSHQTFKVNGVSYYDISMRYLASKQSELNNQKGN